MNDELKYRVFHNIFYTFFFNFLALNNKVNMPLERFGSEICQQRKQKIFAYLLTYYRANVMK